MSDIATGDRHDFQPYPGGRYPNSCVRCGKSRENGVHQVQEEERDAEAR